ncbi:MAG: SBBP repeat-containing protein [Armatimonadetes bacterium]|nr:SBBP repeat-containing protein [Armatimonadota bacterium]
MISGSYAQRNQDFTYCWDHKLTQHPNGKFDKGKDVATYLPHNAVYVVGQTKGGDYHRGFVVRLEACGQGTRVKWIKYIESSTGNASANAVAVDGAGFVYVAGFVHVSGEGHNVFLAKYEPEDGDIWLDEQACGSAAVPFFITYDRDDQDDEAVDLAVTHDGHAFLAATTKGGEFASTDVTVMRAKKCPIIVDDPTPHVEG